jgi:hypothetical protein
VLRVVLLEPGNRPQQIDTARTPMLRESVVGSGRCTQHRVIRGLPALRPTRAMREAATRSDALLGDAIGPSLYQARCPQPPPAAPSRAARAPHPEHRREIRSR